LREECGDKDSDSQMKNDFPCKGGSGQGGESERCMGDSEGGVFGGGVKGLNGFVFSVPVLILNGLGH
jgi:hypothetical protein